MSPIGDSHRARWCQACEDWHFTHETCATWQGGGRVDCSCAERAWRRDPLPADEMPTTKGHV